MNEFLSFFGIVCVLAGSAGLLLSVMLMATEDKASSASAQKFTPFTKPDIIDVEFWEVQN